MRFPSGEKTQAVGNGTSFASGSVRRVVVPVAISVRQTLPSMTWATNRPSGLQLKDDAMSREFLVTCLVGPPLGESVQSCTTPASSFFRNAMAEPSGAERSQCLGAETNPGWRLWFV